jgi:threonine dehydrogenase-like Zn-dependent dehydrogenase
VTTTNNSLRAVVQVGAGKLELHEFARPAVGEDDALLRIEACGLCGTDISQLEGFFSEAGLADPPFIPGHEPLGVIDAIGARAARRWGVSVGDRVAVEPHLSCGLCAACLSGDRTACEQGEFRDTNYGFMSTNKGPGLWGAYAEYMYLDPRTVLHRVSPALPASIAVMFNPIGAGVRWAYEAPSTRLGDTVVILGAGQRGLACMIAAKAAGAAKVIVTDVARAAAKLDLALALGADHVIVDDEEDSIERVASFTGGALADVVVDVSAGATKPVTDAIEMVRRGGTIILAGMKHGREIPGFVSDKLVTRSITMRGVFTVDANSYRQAIRMIESDSEPYRRMHTCSYPLERAAEAIARLAGADGEPPAVHVTLEPQRR